MQTPRAMGHLGQFLQSFGAKPDLAKPLLNQERAQITHSGLIRLLSPEEPTGALEFVPTHGRSWTKKKVGEFRRPFVSKQGTGSRAAIFLDPFEAMKRIGDRLFSGQRERDGHLVLWEPDQRHVDHFVASNRNVTELFFCTSGKSPTKVELDLFGILKKRYAGLDMTLHLFDGERGLTREGPELSL